MKNVGKDKAFTPGVGCERSLDGASPFRGAPKGACKGLFDSPASQA